MKAVHFGAGNIGRGLIGLTLSESGYEVCFVTRNPNQVDALRRDRSYFVHIAGESGERIRVRNVTALHVAEKEAVKGEIAEADLVTTAVGASSLREVAAQIAEGIVVRLRSNDKPLHVIACENAMKASAQLKKHVYAKLPAELHAEASERISFPNAAIDRIVPAQKQLLEITVEPYSEWIVHSEGLKEGFPGIDGVQYAESLEPYIERKLFTVNTGHSSAAYHGFLEGKSTIQETMENSRIREKVESTLEETSRLLIEKHGFNEREQRRYVNQTISRFTNPSFKDKVTRVGRSPLRKLSADERFVRPALQASGRDIVTPYLAESIACALHYDYTLDSEAEIMRLAIAQKGAGHVIRRYMGIPQEHELHRSIMENYERLEKR